MRPLLGLLLLLAGCAGVPAGPPLQTVPAVDLTRYLGTWHEIARYPNLFQDRAGLDCAATTATYTARPDGQVGVWNQCLNAADGDAHQEVRGRAYVVEGSQGAKLRVTFFWPFFGDYWVIGLDPEYRWAVVGAPRRDYLWVLAREPELGAADRAQVEAIVRGAGFDWGRVRETRQALAGRAAAPNPVR
jgi:apolipoprotein D and lipocalin family protein